MTDLESLVRATLSDEAEHAPPGHGLTRRVDERLRSDRFGARAAWLAVAASVALAVTVGGAAMLAGGGPSTLAPGGSGPTPYVVENGNGAGATSGVPDGPLLTEGECAGLTVRLAEPDTSPGSVRTVRPLVPGPDNRWALDGARPLYLQAAGPCLERLTYDVTQRDGVHRVQGWTGDIAQNFRGGLGQLVTDEQVSGTAVVEVVLGCQPTAYCAEQHTVLASLTLSITGPDAPATTRQPAGTPDPVQTTILYTQNGTLTSTVVSGPAPSDGETVTQTVGR